MKDKKKTLIRMDQHLARAIKTAAIMDGTPAYRLLERIVEEWLGANRPKLLEKARREWDDPGPAVDWEEEA